MTTATSSGSKSIDFSRFVVPDTVENAEERSMALSFDVEEIGNQLSDPTRRDGFGDDSTYRQWRDRAQEAMRLKKAEIRWLQAWVVKYNRSRRPEIVDVSANGLLLAALPILNTAVESGVVPEPHQPIVFAIREYMKAAHPDLGGLVTGTISEQAASHAAH